MGEKATTKSIGKPSILSNAFSHRPDELSLLTKVELLRKIDLFRILPQSTLENLAQETRDIVFKKDEIIFEEGLTGSNMYVILSGEILIYLGAKKVAVLKQGEYLGEMSMVDSKSRSASARALSHTLVMEINEDVFCKIIASNPQSLMAMMKTFSKRVRTDLDVMNHDVQSLSNFTHDMRNCLMPLGIAKEIMTDMLEVLEGTRKDHKKRKGWKQVKKCFETMLSVRNNLITMIDQNMAIILKTNMKNKENYVKTETNIAQLVKETVEEIKCHKWIKGKKINHKVKGKAMIALINYLDIKRVLQNLIINAGYVSKKGGKIDVTVEGLDKCIQVSVKDYGCGVSEEAKPLLFKKNYSNKSEGYGIGLVSCKEIISDFHMGHIWFESEEGAGATFSFTLPC